MRTDDLDLAVLRLSSGEGRRLRLGVRIDPVTLAGERFVAEPAEVDATLDVSRTTSGGYALRLRFEAAIAGPCVRCLGPAAPGVSVDTREVDQPGGGPDLDSPYVTGAVLDLGAWARDAFLLAAPDQVLCRLECLGLCPECAVDLNTVGPGHRHERDADCRWAKLRDLGLPADHEVDAGGPT